MTIDGLRMHARVAADPTDPRPPTVVLVHGVGIASPFFVPVVERLAPDFRVFAVDLPGFGLSDKPPHVLNIGELADALAAWLRAEGLERTILLGNLVGCQIVADLAVRNPECVARLILVGPTMDPQARSAWRQIARWLRDARDEQPSPRRLGLRDYWQSGIHRLVLTSRYALEDRIEEKSPRAQAPTLVVRGGGRMPWCRSDGPRRRRACCHGGGWSSFPVPRTPFPTPRRRRWGASSASSWA